MSGSYGAHLFTTRPQQLGLVAAVSGMSRAAAGIATPIQRALSEVSKNSRLDDQMGIDAKKYEDTLARYEKADVRTTRLDARNIANDKLHNSRWNNTEARRVAKVAHAKQQEDLMKVAITDSTISNTNINSAESIYDKLNAQRKDAINSVPVIAPEISPVIDDNTMQAIRGTREFGGAVTNLQPQEFSVIENKLRKEHISEIHTKADKEIGKANKIVADFVDAGPQRYDPEFSNKVRNNLANNPNADVATVMASGKYAEALVAGKAKDPKEYKSLAKGLNDKFDRASAIIKTAVGYDNKIGKGKNWDQPHKYSSSSVLKKVGTNFALDKEQKVELNQVLQDALTDLPSSMDPQDVYRVLDDISMKMLLKGDESSLGDGMVTSKQLIAQAKARAEKGLTSPTTSERLTVGQRFIQEATALETERLKALQQLAVNYNSTGTSTSLADKLEAANLGANPLYTPPVRVTTVPDKTVKVGGKTPEESDTGKDTEKPEVSAKRSQQNIALITKIKSRFKARNKEVSNFKKAENKAQKTLNDYKEKYTDTRSHKYETLVRNARTSRFKYQQSLKRLKKQNTTKTDIIAKTENDIIFLIGEGNNISGLLKRIGSAYNLRKTPTKEEAITHLRETIENEENIAKFTFQSRMKRFP